MFKARVFTLGVLTDDVDIDTQVVGLVAGHIFDKDDWSEDVEI